MSEADCKQLCHSKASCLTFEIWPTGLCCLNEATARDRPSDFVNGGFTSSFYSMTCL